MNAATVRLMAWAGAIGAAGCAGTGDRASCDDSEDCPDGLVCLLYEDSQEGGCFAPACAEAWTGYSCDTSDTGAASR